MNGRGGALSRHFFAHENMRDSQKEMLSDGIEALKNRGFLLAAAPTGIGKTAAALAASLEFSHFCDSGPEMPKIIFMTGRQSQHRIVVDTVKTINSKLPNGFPRIKLVDIIGREGMCKNVDRSTGKCSCEEGASEAQRRILRSKLEDYILSKPRHVNQVLREVEKKKVCAWSTSREAVRGAQILVCDYNHVFIEAVRESSLPVMGIDLKNSILVVDEAHNLPDRIRNGLERRVTYKIFQRAFFEVQEYRGNLESNLESLEAPESKILLNAKSLEKQAGALKEDMGITRWFEENSSLNKATKGEDVKVEASDFLEVVSRALEGLTEEDDGNEDRRIEMFISGLMSVIVENDEDIDEEEVNDCTRLAEILEICIRYKNSTALALVFDNEIEEPRLTSHLLDPGVVGGPIFEECMGSILMSGTLFPPEMYSEILGIPRQRSICKEYSSDFPLGNRPVLIANDVTSKFTERESSYGPIRDHIRSVIENTEGNVAVFATSYSMLERIHNDVLDMKFRKKFEKEEQRMSKSSVERTISKLYEKRMGGVALFGVLSGKFSEGVDYSENVLNAVVCVGLPLPPPSARQDALLDYYTKKFDRNRAWKYASLQPAVNSILQAMGRPIRKKEDRAIVILLERRLLERRFGDCMPKMQKMQTSKPSTTAERVKSFFEMS